MDFKGRGHLPCNDHSAAIRSPSWSDHSTLRITGAAGFVYNEDEGSHLESIDSLFHPRLSSVTACLKAMLLWTATAPPDGRLYSAGSLYSPHRIWLIPIWASACTTADRNQSPQTLGQTGTLPGRLRLKSRVAYRPHLHRTVPPLKPYLPSNSLGVTSRRHVEQPTLCPRPRHSQGRERYRLPESVSRFPR